MQKQPSPRSAAFRTAELAVGGDLPGWLRAQRRKAKSFNVIAGELRDVGVIVTAQTVNNWCVHFGIDGQKKVAS